jgi:hypothetical protein
VFTLTHANIANVPGVQCKWCNTDVPMKPPETPYEYADTHALQPNGFTYPAIVC